MVNKMKQWITSLVLVLFLLVPWAGAVETDNGLHLMDAGAPPAYVTVSSAEAEQGGEAEVTIQLSRARLANLSLQIAYDANAMTLTKVQTERLGCQLRVTSENLTDQPYVLIWANDANVQWTGGTVATLTFRVKEDAAAGAYSVSADYYRGRTDLGKPYEDGEDVNFWLSGGHRNPLLMRYAPGVITVAETERAITAEKTAGGFDVTLAGAPEENSRLIAALYTDKGQLRETRILTAESQTVTFSKAASGSKVKFMWVTETFAPLCPAAEQTIE